MQPAPPRGGRARGFSGGGGGGYGYGLSSPYAYDSAAVQAQEFGDWNPQLRSPDGEINLHRDRMVARQRDLVRNDGMAAGAVAKILDNTVGSRFRWRSAPDYRALAYATGINAFDSTWANEYRQVAEAGWRVYSTDVGRYNDLGRQHTVAQQQRIALRHKLVDGDGLILNHWKPERVGKGRARYATAFQLVDPDRLSNPYQQMDSRYMRGGVEIDDDGAPIAYHIRKAEPNDYYNALESMIWERVPLEDDDGWRRVIHDFDADRANQHRGVGIFAPVLGRLKMLARYYGLELQQAAIGAALGTYVTSPYDQEQVMDAIGGGDSELSAY